MNRESKPRSSTVRANCLIPRARSGPSPSQTYEGRKTPNRPTSLTWLTSLLTASSAAIGGWTFLDERPGALEEVVGREDPDGRFGLGDVTFRERTIERSVDERLDGANRERTPRRDL